MVSGRDNFSQEKLGAGEVPEPRSSSVSDAYVDAIRAGAIEGDFDLEV
jgi:hypothetical protein